MFQVLPDLGVVPVPAGQGVSFQLPAGTVIARDPGGLTVQARQTNGQPLPSWLRFDPATGKFSGKPPAGWNKTLSLEVIVTDQDGNRGQSRVQLQFDQGPAPADAPRASPSAQGKPALNEQFARARAGAVPVWWGAAAKQGPA